MSMVTEQLQPSSTGVIASVQMQQHFCDSVESACQRACAAIAPVWPLDRSIAVNPHWARIGMPMRQVAARMAVLAGMQVYPPAPLLRQAWQQGRISSRDLHEAAMLLPEAAQAAVAPAHLLRALDPNREPPRLPLLIDLLDSAPGRQSRLSWRQAISHQVSQVCATYFDTQQADWQPQRDTCLFQFWRETLLHDHGIGVLMGLPGLGRALDAVPDSREKAEQWLLARLGLPEQAWADYLEAVLLTVNGWASWCAYLGWQAGLEGRQDTHLRDLLAVRLAWGVLALECSDREDSARALAELQEAWKQAPAVLAHWQDELRLEETWQVGLELGYQRHLAARLVQGHEPAPSSGRPEVQAMFCIDVRSEPLRRAIEKHSSSVQTLGFAGFFGVPAAYTPLATPARRPQLPGLLAPSMELADQVLVRDGIDPKLEEAIGRSRNDRLAASARWASAGRWPATAFSFVEAAGLGYLGPLLRWLRPGGQAMVNDDHAGLSAKHRSLCRPALLGLDDAQKISLAAGILRAMGMERNLAPLVLLVGHGSQSNNNAQAAALDCGACGGQTGDVNARSVASLLNEPAVRAGLREKGLVIAKDTWFVAALHNTTTDEIEGFDLDVMPAETAVRWQKLLPVLGQASDQTRRERAPRLGLDAQAPQHGLLGQFRQRANDGAQTRPEWGLAGNAAFIIAPRQRSLGLDLGGRCFLHDYEASQDADGSVLELLMTAPMIVTHWINAQYQASTCDPVHQGSGNKVLHNVVGGNIGVFEGNGGDLRIGLARQSLHDGERWVHEPLRLTVVIDAPQARIEQIIAKHSVLGDLLDNGWLHLWHLDGSLLQRYQRAGWCPLPWDSR